MKAFFAASIAAVAIFVAAGRTNAHPLGNNSITHFSVLKLLPDRLEVDLLLDFAEGPAAQLRKSEIDADADGDDTPEEQQAWLNRKAEEWAPLLSAGLDGHALAFRPVPSASESADGESGETTRLVMKIPGFGGMPTYRVIVRYAAPYPAALGTAPHRLDYADKSYTGTPGLRRILLERSPAATFTGSRPPFWDEGADPFLYEQYDPGNLPDERSTTFTFTLTPAAAEAAATPAADQDTTAAPAGASATKPTADSLPKIIGSFTDPRNNPAKTAEYYRQADRLITMLRGRWGLMILLTVTALSFVWGAAHALMPGHAKTVVAAYLISQHGTYRHAVLLAIIVTITHTALVVLLGLVIWFYQASHPELGPKLQLWLGTLAGVLVGAMGLTLIWRAVTGRIGHHHHKHGEPAQAHEHEHHHSHEHPHEHSHGHAHAHSHAHDQTHSHEHRSWLRRLFTHSHPTPDAAESGQLTTRTLLILGITGGIVPCPTAMIIMLLGIGANVVLGALYAVGVFSLGLSLTLMAIGFAALSSRRVARRLLADAAHEGELSAMGQRLLLQAVPAGSGLLVLGLGAAITAHYIHLLRTGQPLFGWMG